MEILSILIPVSLLLGGIGLAAFLWSLRSRQYEDPKGDAQRILSSEWDDRPKPPPLDQNSDP
ncbi:cbb3-type cytochrome oxidase assembly protein CcoS [Paracoccus aerodenitrificans]|uniref:cbb3-type cytochrome oxidase assembly protein CcoS n=1 Tax=Paracoccus aerodenitrificans TaxID=3017781 RepID=UPI0022F10578|nr:cbb3-type cytochrome oxidase assembly protein CcoS [Paracoccus aerodenitrificans]WBU65196.1 cbb3-type cytochrome oxidase assembly protein CcoS [Paracoccus aerodenitrificans]